MDPWTRRLTIKVQGAEGQTAEDPIVGRLTDEHVTSVSFSGWLGLVSGLERLLEPGRTRRRGPAGERVQEPPTPSGGPR